MAAVRLTFFKVRPSLWPDVCFLTPYHYWSGHKPQVCDLNCGGFEREEVNRHM